MHKNRLACERYAMQTCIHNVVNGSIVVGTIEYRVRMTRYARCVVHLTILFWKRGWDTVSIVHKGGMQWDKLQSSILVWSWNKWLPSSLQLRPEIHICVEVVGTRTGFRMPLQYSDERARARGMEADAEILDLIPRRKCSPYMRVFRSVTSREVVGSGHL